MFFSFPAIHPRPRLPAVQCQFAVDAALKLERRFQAGPSIRSRVFEKVGIGNVGESVVPDHRAVTLLGAEQWSRPPLALDDVVSNAVGLEIATGIEAKQAHCAGREGGAGDDVVVRSFSVSQGAALHARRAGIANLRRPAECRTLPNKYRKSFIYVVASLPMKKLMAAILVGASLLMAAGPLMALDAFQQNTRLGRGVNILGWALRGRIGAWTVPGLPLQADPGSRLPTCPDKPAPVTRRPAGRRRQVAG